MHKIIPFVLFITFFAVSVLLAPHFGPSWDEPDNIFAGGVYHNFFRNNFNPSILTLRYEKSASVYSERVFTQNFDLERYPPFPLLIGSGAVWLYELLNGSVTGGQIISLYHIASGLFLSLSVVATYGLSRLLKQSHLVSLIAAVLLGLLPTMFGHGLSTIKDSAQVAMFTSGLFFLVSFTYSHRRRYLFIGAILWGLGLATKFNAIYIPIIWFGHYLSVFLSDHLQRRSNQSWQEFIISILTSATKTLIPSLISFLSLGILTMFIVWPYLWFNPWARFLEVVRYFTTVGAGYQVAWMGERFMVGVGQAYWWYPLGSLFLATPLVIILCFLTATVLLLKKRLSIIYQWITNNPHKQIKHHQLPGLLVALWLTIPFLRIFSPTAAYYDGMRHFMEVLPVIAIISAIGIQTVITIIVTSRLKDHLPFLNRPQSATWLLLGLSTIVVTQLSFFNAYLFPYSSAYLNPLAGTNKNIGFDRDFSGLAMFEGMKFIQANYQAPFVWGPIAGHLSWYYMPPGGTYVYSQYDADTIIYINKISHSTQAELEAMLPSDFQLAHTIKRGSDILGWVYRRL